MSGKILLLIGTVVVVCAAMADARTIRIRADYGTIQEGIDAAVSGDTVLLGDGIFNLGYHMGSPPPERDYDLRLRAKNIVLTSEHGPEFTLIDGSSYNYPDDDYAGRVIWIEGPVDSTCVISNITLSGYLHLVNGSLGACILLDSGANPTIENCHIWGMTHHGAGGAICCRFDSNPIIRNCKLSGSAFAHRGDTYLGGGAIAAFNSSPRVSNCTISQGRAVGGGAFRGVGFEGLFQDCIFENNSSEKSQLLPSDPADGSGGAVQLVQSAGRFERCTFVGNSVYSYVESPDSLVAGGAVALLDYSTTDFVQCTFVNNYTFLRGAGYAEFMPPQDFGQHIYVQSGALNLLDCIVAFGPWHAAIKEGLVISYNVHCNDIYGHPGGNWTGTLALAKEEEGNVERDPHFCDTTTHEFYLASNSPGAPANNACGELYGAWAVDENCATTCCEGWTGNVDGDPDDKADVGDLTALIDNLFINFTLIDCGSEANCDGAGPVDVGDLTALIDNLFINFTPLPGCGD